MIVIRLIVACNSIKITLESSSCRYIQWFLRGFLNICLKNDRAASINQPRDHFKQKQNPPLFDACVASNKSTNKHKNSITV